jgi:hypothetical protein
MHRGWCAQERHRGPLNPNFPLILPAAYARKYSAATAVSARGIEMPDGALRIRSGRNALPSEWQSAGSLVGTTLPGRQPVAVLAAPDRTGAAFCQLRAGKSRSPVAASTAAPQAWGILRARYARNGIEQALKAGWMGIREFHLAAPTVRLPGSLSRRCRAALTPCGGPGRGLRRNVSAGFSETSSTSNCSEDCNKARLLCPTARGSSPRHPRAFGPIR